MKEGRMNGWLAGLTLSRSLLQLVSYRITLLKLLEYSTHAVFPF